MLVMTVLPDIIREPAVVSVKPSTMTPSVSAPSLMSGLKKLRENTTQISFASAPSGGDISATTNFPALIFNDSNRSTSYHRLNNNGELALKVANSPLETNSYYNWPSTQRLQTNIVKSKSKVYKPASRISQPARPPAPYKVNTSFETSDPNFHNEKRTLEMKRWQYLREHTQWSIYPYAQISEREYYNKQIRETLKDQMEQKLRNNQRDFMDNCKESKLVLEKDRTDLETDRTRNTEKSKFLNQYSQQNKKIMEDRWMNQYVLKRNEWVREREILNDSPINWSKTLR